MKRTKIIASLVALAGIAAAAPANAIATSCGNFLRSASGWQWIAEMFANRCNLF